MTRPQDEHTLCDEAADALSAGDLHRAADLCKSLLVSYPQSASAYHLTSRLYHATGNVRKACDYSSIAAELDRNVEHYHLQQGQMLFLLKEYEAAQAAFERAVAIAGHGAGACRALANSLVAQERFAEARQWFSRAREHASPVDTVVDEALCDMQEGEYDAAERLLRHYIFATSHNANAYYVLAQLAIIRGEFEEAGELLRQAIKRNEKHVESYFYLSLVQAEAGDEQEAVRSLLAALGADPTHLPSLLTLGGVFLKSNDLASAEKAFNHAIALDSDDVFAWFGLLEVLHEKDGLRDGLARLSDHIKQAADTKLLRHVRALFSGDVPPCAPKEYVARFYGTLVGMFEPWVIAASHGPHIEELARSLRSLPQFKNHRPISLLDLGCGAGELTSQLYDMTAIRAGVDLSPHMLKLARRARKFDVLYELDMTEFALGSETQFDIVAATGALRWSGNLQPFFSAVRNVMHRESVLACMLEKEPSSLAYSVGNDGRYSHHFTYVRDVAQAEGLQLLMHKEWLWDAEAEEPQARHIFLFKKMTVH